MAVDIRNQRQFYSLLLNDDSLISFLTDKGLIQRLLNRCKNCHKYNTLREKVIKRKRNMNDSSSDVFGDSIEKFIYICSKYF